MEKILKFKNLDVHYKYFHGSKNLWNVLILHGRGGSSDSRVKVAEKLAEQGYDIYIPDLPGFGKTVMDKVYTVDEYSKLVENFVAKLNIWPVILIGHSNGGRISIRMTKNKIIQTKKLFLIASAGIKPKKTLKKIFFEKIAKIFKIFQKFPWYSFFRKIIYKLIWGHDYLGVKDDFTKQTFLNMIDSDQKDEISQIDLPTTLIWWDKDTYTPLQDWKLMHSLIKNSSLIVLKDYKHGIHLQNPSLLFEKITQNL